MRNLVPNPFSTTGAVEETLVEVPSYSKGRARRARKKRRWGRCCKQRRYHTAYRWYCVWCHKNENTSTCSCTLCKCHHAPQTVPFSLKESIQETWKTLKQGWSGLTDVVSAVGLWLGRITRLVTPQSTTATPASGGEEDGGVVQREGVDAEAGRRAEEKKGGTEDGAGREDGGGGVTRKRGRRKRKKKGRGRGRGNKKNQIPHAVEEKKPATAHKLFG